MRINMRNAQPAEYDSAFHDIRNERPDASDIEEYGLGEAQFRQFQEDRKRAAQRADEEDLSRELMAERARDRR
jgi:hypothetical protein